MFYIFLFFFLDLPVVFLSFCCAITLCTLLLEDWPIPWEVAMFKCMHEMCSLGKFIIKLII